jgi:hypothetical protein
LQLDDLVLRSEPKRFCDDSSLLAAHGFIDLQLDQAPVIHDTELVHLDLDLGAASSIRSMAFGREAVSDVAVGRSSAAATMYGSVICTPWWTRTSLRAAQDGDGRLRSARRYR